MAKTPNFLIQKLYPVAVLEILTSKRYLQVQQSSVSLCIRLCGSFREIQVCTELWQNFSHVWTIKYVKLCMQISFFMPFDLHDECLYTCTQLYTYACKLIFVSIWPIYQRLGYHFGCLGYHWKFSRLVSVFACAYNNASI